jgi:gamma-glutamyltranspeptidase / glutathione hydrolase
LFEPAIRYAEEGYPVSPVVAEYWKRAEEIYLPLNDTIFSPLKEVFFRNNRAPAAGEIWGSVAHAETLREIATSGGESFYKGKLAEKIANYTAETGGFLRREDLVAHQADWVTPINTNYRDLTVWEMPPNTQGIAALMALNILENFDVSQYPRESVDSYHWQIEAMKLAFADVKRYVGDADFMQVGVEELLDKNYGKKRAELITEKAINLAKPGLPKGGTVYLAAADGDLMVSFIQSNYMGFGSGVVVPGTGIALHNRGFGFSLEEGHPNEYSPGKRAYHTIIPGFLTKEGVPVGPFGVMGGPMQPQGHLQMVVNMADYEMNPQAALDAPRWQFIEGNLVLVESGVSESIIEGLQRRGHDVRLGDLKDGSDVAETGQFGRGQIIVRENGVFVAGSEPRADGLAMAW